MAGATKRGKAAFCLGDNLEIPMELHSQNRTRLLNRLKGEIDTNSGAFVVLQGGETLLLDSSDKEILFRQESYFHWSFGVLEPGFLGAIDVATGASYLFMPRLPESYSVWMGKLDTPEEVQAKYSVDGVYYIDEMEETLNSLGAKTLLTLRGKNTDSGNYTREATFEGIGNFHVDNSTLHPEMAECRVVKTALELNVLRFSNRISSEAHRHLMRTIRPGMYEYQAESIFQNYCYLRGGMRHIAYTCIGATGCNCAVLHYGHAGAPNERLMENNDMCLFDMGGEYYCYTSDITCSYPVNGKFTEDQKKIYEAVLASSQAVQNACKPGVSWASLHQLAERIILTHLTQHGFLQGNVDEMMSVYLGAIFMPHGLGHFMGCDVHDVGGYLEGHPERSTIPGVTRLRTGRILEANMVLTIEPGCYFIDTLLDRAFANPEQARFLIRSEIDRFRGTGGVRIEDDIIVTETGIEMMTDVPRTVEEIETWMSVKNEDPRKD